MNNLVTNESFRDLVGNSRMFGFAREILTESYMDCAPGQEAAMRLLMEQAFARLAACQHDERLFQEAAASLAKDVFGQGWFASLYRNYKREIKPQRRLHKLLPYLSGTRVLDFGCGDGMLSAALHHQGYQVLLTDVLDYRAPAAKDLPFAPMPAPARIPYPDGSADTAIVLAVLHHIAGEDLTPLLAELRRVSRRVIVEEDTYELRDGLLAGGPLAHARPDALSTAQLRGFIALSEEDQLRYLMFVDYFANAITQSIAEMNMPFNFRPVAEWQSLFTAQGFRLAGTVLMGFQSGYFNRSCHVWFILDRED